MDEQPFQSLRRCRTSDVYRIIKPINKGSYGDVYLAERICDRVVVCLKQVDLDFLSPSEQAGCLAEVQFLQSLPRHPHVVGCYDAFVEDTSEMGDLHHHHVTTRLVLVLEYGDAGDLDTLIQREFTPQPEPTLSVDQAMGIFAQIVSGVAFLHHHHILHRDLKSKNVFRFADGRVVVGDFGTSKSVADTQSWASTLVGSPLYMSPELLDGQQYSFPSDIWSLGCVGYELFMGKTPFQAPSYPAVVIKITKGLYEPLPPRVPLDLQELVTSMLHLDPHQRPTAEQILSGELVKKYAPGRAFDMQPLVRIDTQSSDQDHHLQEPSVLLLPPPPPLMVHVQAQADSGLAEELMQLSLPPPPAPVVVVVPPKIKSRQGSPAAVFPTTRASLANIVSRERLHLHRQQRQIDTTPTSNTFLSCVPVLDATILSRPPPPPASFLQARQPIKTKRAATSPPAKTNSSLGMKPRLSPVPQDNMMIIGKKVNSIITTTRHND